MGLTKISTDGVKDQNVDLAKFHMAIVIMMVNFYELITVQTLHMKLLILI